MANIDVNTIKALELLLQFLVFPLLLYALSQFKKMRESVEILNIQIAVVIARLDNHDQRLSKIEEKM